MDKKSRSIFYGVLLIATLIVAIVGTSLAYFTYRTNSGYDGVKATAADIKVRYYDGKQVTAQADELVPATLEVVKNVYQTHIASNNGNITSNENLCIDSKGNQVCSVYQFSIISDIDIEAYASLNTENNEFNYLSYAVRDVNNNTWLSLGDNSDSAKLAKCSSSMPDNNCYTENNTEKKYSLNPNTINSIFGYNSNSTLKDMTIGPTEHVYDLVLFIEENNKDQNIDQGKKYQGTIYVSTNDDFATILK